jgi:hypothetical protein
MSHQEYCRFRDTLTDLKDCLDNIDDTRSLGESELQARLGLIKLCTTISDKHDLTKQIEHTTNMALVVYRHNKHLVFRVAGNKFWSCEYDALEHYPRLSGIAVWVTDLYPVCITIRAGITADNLNVLVLAGTWYLTQLIEDFKLSIDPTMTISQNHSFLKERDDNLMAMQHHLDSWQQVETRIRKFRELLAAIGDEPSNVRRGL